MLKASLAEFSNPPASSVSSYVVVLDSELSMQSVLYLVCIVLVLFTANCQACRCVQKPLHEAFCDADFGKHASISLPFS